MESADLTAGPFRFVFWPDGDDPGTGWINVWVRDERVVVFQATQAEWDLFVSGVTVSSR